MKIVMPQIGMTMVTGIINEWKVKDGERVNKGDVILQIVTEKLENDLAAPVSGTIRLMAEEGDTIDCGAQIAEIIED